MTDGYLSLSLRAKAVSEDAFPDEYHFSIRSLELAAGLNNGVHRLLFDEGNEDPIVAVYTTFHASEINARISIEVINEDKIKINLRIVTEDVNYYDERAKPNIFEGAAYLSKEKLENLWMPE